MRTLLSQTWVTFSFSTGVKQDVPDMSWTRMELVVGNSRQWLWWQGQNLVPFWYMSGMKHVKKKKDFNHVIMTAIFTFDPTLPAEPEMPHRVLFIYFLIKKLTTSELELTNGYVSPFPNSQGDGLCAEVSQDLRWAHWLHSQRRAWKSEQVLIKVWG